MDSLDWKILNKDIEIKETKKKFYNRYFCSLKYFCPGGRALLSSNPNLEEVVNFRLEFEKSYSYNYGGTWRQFRTHYQEINIPQLLEVKLGRDEYKNQLLVRVEEPNITFYTVNESTMYEFANKYLSAWKNNIKTVFVPKDEKSKQSLEQGFILVKQKTDYPYKIVCKSGRCYNKSAITNYLYNLGDTVKVSDSVWTLLENHSDSIWNVWFYTNDPSIADMLNIIEPNFVTNIHKLVVEPE